MVFSSLEFLLLFLTVTLLVYFVVPLKLRNIVLLVVSLIFYGWGEPVYVFLMIFTITVDYIFGLLVERAQKRDDPKRARLHLILSVVINLAILGFFKYYNFFVSNLRLIPGLGWLPLLGIELPIGISFYTFQALSYVIDVYRRDTGAQHNIASFGAYVTLYPQLIAGPIVRYKDVDDQLTVREHSVPLFAEGCRTFIAGMGKKILLANTAGQLWEYFGYALLRVPDLLRLLGLLGHGDRSWQDDRLPVHRKLRLPLHIKEHHRVLAALAYVAQYVVPRLCVYPTRRQPLLEI